MTNSSIKTKTKNHKNYCDIIFSLIPRRQNLSYYFPPSENFAIWNLKVFESISEKSWYRSRHEKKKMCGRMFKSIKMESKLKRESDDVKSSVDEWKICKKYLLPFFLTKNTSREIFFGAFWWLLSTFATPNNEHNFFVFFQARKWKKNHFYTLFSACCCWWHVHFFSFIFFLFKG
jgi:hypothetical protein